MKISNIVIGLMFVTLVGTVLTMFMSQTAVKYGTTYNESELEFYNSLNETNVLIEQLEAKTTTDAQRTGETDILGSFLSDGVGAMKIAKSSLSTYDTMINVGGKQLGLPKIFGIILVSILSLIVIFIIISISVKKDV